MPVSRPSDLCRCIHSPFSAFGASWALRTVLGKMEVGRVPEKDLEKFVMGDGYEAAQHSVVAANK